MLTYWIIFSVIALVIPLSFMYFRINVLGKQDLTVEQQKRANLTTVKYIFLFLLYDLFYMSIFNRWMILEYAFGIFSIIIIFGNLIHALLSGNPLIAWMMPFDLLLGIGITVYLIYRVPVLELQTILTAIIAAVYGGLLTLVGVAWTIKKSDNDRKQSEEQRSKPLVFISNPNMTSINKEELMKGILLSKMNIGSLKNAEANKVAFTLPQVVISNSDYSHVVIRGFRINDEYHLYDHGQVLPKNKTFYLQNDFRFEYPKEIEYVALLLQDMLENIYELELNFSINKKDKNKTIIINSGIDTRKTTLAINPKET